MPSPAKRRRLLIWAACIAVVAVRSSYAQLPFFPGAEGYGGSFAGSAPVGGWFSNATVYHVTNLNDSGAGSLRGAFVENSANKIIVFDVGGTITLTDSLDIKNLANYYIAGQTAPSPVTIYGDTTQVTHSSGKQATNVILRYLTFRKGSGDGEDAITFAGSGLGSNLIFDHVSASWAEDEILSVTNNNTNVTVQYSIISDALVSGHAYGSLLRAKIDSNVSVHHNLYANNASRQARFGSYEGKTLTADFRNNVIYNWRDRASYAGGSSESEQEFANVNYVGNYLIAGPNTIGSATQVWGTDKNVTASVYQSGNYVDSDKSVNPGGVPNGSLATNAQFIISPPQTDQTLTMAGTPFAMPAVTTQSAGSAFSQVIDYVGNYWWNRSSIDLRIVNNVKNNTGPPGGIGASAPNAAELATVTGAPMVTRPAGYDTDNDGMPDDWELKHGLNPNSSLDFKLDFDNDGYINLVEFLNEAGEFPAPAPIVWNGAANTRYANIMNWKTNDGGVTAGSNWQPSKYDTAVIHSGSVAVDSVGQHARTLQVGPTAGDVASLSVTSGWIEVADTLAVGGGGSGTVNHSGGLVTAENVAIGGAGGAGAYNLSGGGVLMVGTLSKASNSDSFAMTGGVLSAEEVAFDLTNNGGTIAPGVMLGETHVAGDLTLATGTIEIQVASPSPGLYDKINVDGVANLGGTLKLTPIDLGGGLYTPQLGDVIGFLSSAGASGMFTAFDLPALGPNLAWELQPGNVTTFLTVVSTNVLDSADFDHSGVVNGADLVLWTAGLGMTGQTNNLNGDANGDSEVDGADLLIWQQHLGNGQNSIAAANAVPEPTSAAIAVAVGIALVGSRLRRSI